MSKRKNLLFYLIVTAFFGLLMYLIARWGRGLEPEGIRSMKMLGAQGPLELFTESMHHNVTHPLAILILQILSIIAVARVFGFFFRKIGQPAVIGEIVAGIVLGPSVVGAILPDLSAFLFPPESLGNLQFLSQVGLILFMFVVGMELDISVLWKKAGDAVVISHASIIIPYALGMGLAYFIYASFAPEGVPFLSFALFMGIAMSITAFPVLARILQERGLTKTRLGAIVITCAAADDITAWCLLAAVIAIVKAGTWSSTLFTIALATTYVAFMTLVLQPFLRRLGEIYSNREMMNKGVVAAIFMILLLSSYLTEVIGIHALFGAFLAGVIMPANSDFRRILIEKVEDVSLLLLLPLFFVFTGLRTQIGLLNDPALWGTFGLIILVAVSGKFIGSAFAARFVNQSWRDSLMIGALMNTRGLMELIVLNIGYELGILGPEIFAMLVLMALLTTFMTGPTLNLIDRLLPAGQSVQQPALIKNGVYRILFSFGPLRSGLALLKLAGYLTGRQSPATKISALHLTAGTDVNPLQAELFERESFGPLREEAKRLGLPIDTQYRVTDDVSGEIIRTANQGGYDLLLVGAGKSLYRDTLLGNLMGATSKALQPDRLIETLAGREHLLPQYNVLVEKTQQFIEDARCDVGVFIGGQLEALRSLYLPLLSPEDVHLFDVAGRFIRQAGAVVHILDPGELIPANPTLRKRVDALGEHHPQQVEIIHRKILDREFLQTYDLMLISYLSWVQLVESKSLWLSFIPSTLIIRPFRPESRHLSNRL